MDERDAHPPRDPPRSSRHRARTAEEFHAFDNTAFESTRAPPTKILNVILPRREPSRRDSGPRPLPRVSVLRVSYARTERPNPNPSIDRSARAHTARVASSSARRTGVGALGGVFARVPKVKQIHILLD